MSTSKTEIAWTERTWNPVRGCSLVSAGCTNCYAMRQAHRFSKLEEPFEGLTRRTEHGPVWTGEVRLVEEAIEEPLRWRKPCRVFVNSMSDLFHEEVPLWFVHEVFETMRAASWHTFQILTKRPERAVMITEVGKPPPRNIWLGTSIEDQATADKRIPLLLKTPAAVRWISYEPALGPVTIDPELLPFLQWIVVGGESGPGARPCNLDWIRNIVRQCRAACVPVFVKQLGANVWFGATQYGPASPKYIRDRKGSDPAEWPEDLRVREYPSATL